jgi:tripartite-type tricarboxylate transporter receptor subunit TctC
LAPITLITVTPAILVVNPSSTVHSVNDLIALAKSQPGKVSFSSSGIGGTAHLAGEMLNTMTGVSMLHVPYKGTGPANTAVLTGQVTMSFSDMISTLHFVQGGQLRAIAVTSPQRSALLPDVPAISETLPGYSSAPWFGLFAPAGTPPAIIDRINREVARILSAPDMVEKLRLQGAIPMSTSPAEFAAYIKADSDKWGSVIRAANIPTE